MTAAIKRACDPCHRRKVKCDGFNPCKNCNNSSLSCTYNAIPQKKGPKGSRAKIISDIRETQRHNSLHTKVHARIAGAPCTPAPEGVKPTPGFLTPDVVSACIKFFFDHMYAQMPILDQRAIESQIPFMEQNPDTYCLVGSLCAFVMMQPGMSIPANDYFNFDMYPGALIAGSQTIMEEVLRVRKGVDHLDNVTHNALATTFFLFGCNYAMEMHNHAWFYLREGTTLIHMAGMTQEGFYATLDSVESSRRRRLFWLFFVMERAYAVGKNRPLTLQATINVPTSNDDQSDPLANHIGNFLLLVDAYKPIDDAFLSTWRKTHGNLSASHVDNMRKQMGELLRSYYCQDSSFGDMHVNQSWLKNTVWQLTSQDSYSTSVSRDLLMRMAAQFPGQGMELMNSSLLSSVLGIVHSMAEFLAVQPASGDPFAPGPQDKMATLLNTVALSRNGDHTYLPVLLTDVAEILPRLATPMLQNPPEDPNLANVDIFDGFGNGGMAQPPPQMQMDMETPYDQKFTPEEYEQQYAAAMDLKQQQQQQQHSTPDSQGSSSQPQQPTADMNSNFVSSPGIMATGGDYNTQMGGFNACTPMSEIMSPMAHQQPHMSQQQHLHSSHPHQQTAQQPQQQPPPQPYMYDGMNQHHIQHINTLRQPPPQRQHSFQVQVPMRTVGDFQGLQPSGQDNGQGMVGLGSMSNEIDFGALQ